MEEALWRITCVSTNFILRSPSSGFVGEFRENRQGQVTEEAAMFAAYTSSIVESRPAPRGKGNK